MTSQRDGRVWGFHQPIGRWFRRGRRWSVRNPNPRVRDPVRCLVWGSCPTVLFGPVKSRSMGVLGTGWRALVTLRPWRLDCHRWQRISVGQTRFKTWRMDFTRATVSACLTISTQCCSMILILLSVLAIAYELRVNHVADNVLQSSRLKAIATMNQCFSLLIFLSFDTCMWGTWRWTDATFATGGHSNGGVYWRWSLAVKKLFVWALMGHQRPLGYQLLEHSIGKKVIQNSKVL
jgi:hypothetical protein